MVFGVGEALGVAALVAGIKGTLDTILFLDDLLRHDDDAHFLLLRYETINISLKQWLEKVDAMIARGNDPISRLAPDVKRLFVAHLTEIDRCKTKIGKCLQAQDMAEIPTYHDIPDAQPLGNRVVSPDDHQKWKLFGPKRSKKFKLLEKEPFRMNVEKLSQSVDSLDVILDNVVSTERNAIALVASLLPELRKNKLSLEMVAKAPDTFGSIPASVARLNLADMDPSLFPAAPQIPASQIELDDMRPHTLKSMGFYNSHRVIIEWKHIDPGLDSSSRDKVIERVETLGALLCQPKEAEFRVPVCLGIYTSSQLQKGYVYSLPSSQSELLGWYTLADRLQPQVKAKWDASGESKRKLVKKTPLLGERFRLAYTLAKAFYLLHSAEWLHKDFRSCNVLFFDKNGGQADSETIAVDEMYVTGFQYSRPNTAGEPSIETQPTTDDINITIYRHPDVDKGYHKLYDLYSLGVVLFELALWEPLHTRISKDHALDGEARQRWLIRAVDGLGARVGSVYRDVVKACLTGEFGMVMDDNMNLNRAILLKVVEPLRSCKA